MTLQQATQHGPKTTVVNVLTDHYDLYIGREGLGLTGVFGTPYRLYRDGDRREIMQKYRTYFYKRLANDEVFFARIQTLKGLRLGCICREPALCHGAVIAEYLNGL